MASLFQPGGSSSSHGVAQTTAVKPFSGTRGKTYLNFRQHMRGMLNGRRNTEQGKGVDVHAGSDMYMVRCACVEGSLAYQLIGDIMDEFETYCKLADKGWYPPMQLPDDLTELLLHEHLDRDAASVYLRSRLQKEYKPIYDAANAKGWVARQHDIPHLLQGELTPEQVLKFSQPAQAEQQSATAGATPSTPQAEQAAWDIEAGGRPAAAPAAASASAAAPGQQTDSIAQLASVLRGMQSSGRDKLRYMVLAKGMPQTPHSAVNELFWVAMDLCFALAGQAELPDFFELMVPGSQRNMEVMEFAQHVQLRFDVVAHLDTVGKDAPLKVFKGGLNSAESRKFAADQLDNSIAQGHTMDLMRLAKVVQRYEARQLRDQTMERQAQAYVKLPLGGISSGTGGAGSSSLSKKAAAAEMVRLRAQDSKVQEQLAGMPQSKRQLFQAAFQVAETDPKSELAVCTDCKPYAKLHLNSDCRTKQAKKKQEQQAAVAMAAKQAEQASAAVKDKEESSALAAQLQQTNLQVQQLGDTMSQFMAMSALGGSGQLRPGQFNAAPRPQRGFNSQQQQSSSGPCNLCGFPGGHKGTCYCDDPSRAPENWLGPGPMTLEAGVQCYLQRMAHLNGIPKLQRCLTQAMKLKQEGKVPRQFVALIDSLWQQKQQASGMYAAAVQYWQPPGFFQGGMGAPMMPNPFAAMSQAAPLQLPAPPAAAMGPAAGVGAAVQQVAQVPQPPQEGNPFAFAMAALQCEPDYDSVAEAVAAVSTRSSKVAADGAAEDKAPVSTRVPMPKGFMPPKQQHVDANSSQARVTTPTLAQVLRDSLCQSGSQQRLKKQEELAELMLKTHRLLSEMAAETAAAAEQEESERAGEEAELVASMAAKSRGTIGLASDTSSTAALHGLAADVPSYSSSSSSSSSSSTGGQGPASSASSPRRMRPGKRVTFLRFAFDPEYGTLGVHNTKRISLDRISAVVKEDGITVTLPDGRDCLLEDVIVDSGSNTLLVTEELCKALGLHINRDVELPKLKGIDGAMKPYLVGRTAPFTLTLGKGSAYPAVLHVPDGALVMKGNAGGMYSMCLDKQTLLPVYGHVNPALQKLLWYPHAAEGDYSVVNGVSVTSLQLSNQAAALAGVGITGTESVAVALAAISEQEEQSCAGVSEATAGASSTATGESAKPGPKQSSCCEEQHKAAEPAAAEPDAESQPSLLARAMRGALSLRSAVLLWSVLLMAGIFHYLVDRPLGGLPSWLFSELVKVASWKVPSTPMDQRPKRVWRADVSADTMAHRSSTAHGHRARKRGDYGIWHARHYWQRSLNWKLQLQPTGARWSKLLCSWSARLLLFVLLCLLFSCTSAGAMQVTGSTTAAGATQLSTGNHRPNWQTQQQQVADTCAQQLLHYELAQLAVDPIGAAAESTATKWYTADPSALDQLSPDGTPEEAFDAAWSVHPTGQWILGNHPESTPQQRAKLVELLEKHKGAFAYSLSEVPGYTKSLVSFKLIDPNKRMWEPPRRHTEEEYAFGDEKVKEMYEAGIIKELPTTNPHAANITLPMKRAPDGSWTDKRFAYDARVQNSNSVVDKYGMPLPEELFRRIRGAKFLVKADLRSGFWQLHLDEESQKQMAFWWRNRLYAYTRLPFGHVNATAIFQRVMDTELREAGLSHCSAPFVDDVLLWADTYEDMLQRLETLLVHLQKVGLRLHPAKTILGAQCLPYLGHLVSAEECRPEPAKIAGIKALLPPTCLKQLQAQLGLFNYYRCYVKDFNHLAQPLYKLLQKGAEYIWSDEAQQAYDGLKAALCTDGLALKQPDDKLPFHLYVDWSNTGIAAVLNQKAADGTEYLVACASRSLNPAEKNYPAWKGEMLAAVWGVKMFRPYLHSREFFLHTDHRALLWLLTHKNPVGQQMRWVLALQEYRFTLVHKQGSSNPADVPSRHPSSCLADTTGARLDTHVTDWPLPKVVFTDGKPDKTVYSHDQLAQQLAITGPSTTARKADRSVMAVSSAAAALAAACVPAVADDDVTMVAAAASLAAVCKPATALVLTPTPTLAASQVQYEALACCLASNATALDDILPAPASLLGGGAHGLFQASSATEDIQHPAVAWKQHELQRAASGWVARVADKLHQLRSSYWPGRYKGHADSAGVRHTEQLDTTPCANSFFPKATAEGIVLYEPFGGLCAGLEMALRNGFTIQQYIYGDISPVAQQVALHRMRSLQTMYPLQLPVQALEGAFVTLPMDITQVTSQHIKQALETAPVSQWLVVAGWPCQDLSTAGTALGLRGNRSSLLFDLVRVLGALQQLAATAPAYIIENVVFQAHQQQQIAVQDTALVHNMLGMPITLDAAQFGSLAHRNRNYWTNLADTSHLAATLVHAERPAGRDTSMALQSGRLSQSVNRTESAPWYPCNSPGNTMAAWPTLMSYTQSYAFRPGQPGSVLDVTDPSQPRWDEPMAQEREIALGYLPGSTAAAGVTEAQRRHILGQCIDANVLQVFMATAKALWNRTFLVTDNSSLHCLLTQEGKAPADSKEGSQAKGHSPKRGSEATTTNNNTHTFTTTCALAAAADLQEEAQRGSQKEVDIWSDQPVMQYLRTGELPAELEGQQRVRVQRRAQSYFLLGEQLMRRMPDGSQRVVPEPSQRAQLICQQHELCGHYGVRRTAALVMTKYWWYGLLADTAKVVGRCEHCRRVHASFTAKPEKLQSIPISSMGFRWHVDLTGPLPKSERGNLYIMVAIEAFSKFLVAVPIPDKEAETVAYHFKQSVLAQFAAPGQVVTDSGSEFEGAFAQLLEDCMIDHCGISVAHPQANGQAEKAVHVVKRALQTVCSAKQVVKTWDLEVPMVVLGYQCSPQRSTGFTPYELMFARPPVVPPAVKEVLASPLDYDSPDAAAKDLALRKQRLQQQCPIALGNLAAAQHRDQLRYLQVRAPDYKPRTHRFAAGDYVYLQQGTRNSKLMPRARDIILRVQEVRDTGVLVLQGRCGRSTTAHMSQCSPCHLPDIDGAIDPLLIEDTDDIMCEVCGTDEQKSVLLLCDFCNCGYHTFCLQPPLDNIPDGYWLCPACQADGVTEQQVQERELERERQTSREKRPNLFPSAQTRKRDAAAKALDQRLIMRTFKGRRGQSVTLWGRLHFTEDIKRPWYFKLVYEDGDVLDATVAGVKRYLMPEGTPLPDGVVIPSLSVEGTAVAAVAGVGGQQVLASRHGLTVQIPSVMVPTVDMALLSQRVQFSLAQAISDPITRSPQWQQQLRCSNAPITVQAVQHGAAVLIMAPAAVHLAQAVYMALKHKPALLLCYSTGLAFPTALYSLWQALSQQQRALSLRGHKGWWLLVVQPGTSVQQWLR
jgi:site-specific DNA-cytosine methylase